VIDRHVPRKPPLFSGVKGHPIKYYYLSGKLPLQGGELRFLFLSSIHVKKLMMITVAGVTTQKG